MPCSCQLIERQHFSRRNGVGARGVLEVDAGAAQLARSRHQSQDDTSSLLVSESLGWMDIGNSVSIRVGTTDAGKVSQIDPDTVRNGEPWTFADQETGRAH